MPLVVITGHPCCGKTDFSNQLLEYLKTKNVWSECICVNEESLGIEKQRGYSDATSEKSTRAAIKSAVNRILSPNTLVIVDSINYIKGFRYELFCISRSQRTQHCVVWITMDQKLSENRHNIRPPSLQYPENLFLDLKRRFEPPNSRNRWDCPLFRFDMTNTKNPNLLADEPHRLIELESQILSLEINTSHSKESKVYDAITAPTPDLKPTDSNSTSYVDGGPTEATPKDDAPAKKSSWIRKAPPRPPPPSLPQETTSTASIRSESVPTALVSLIYQPQQSSTFNQYQSPPEPETSDANNSNMPYFSGVRGSDSLALESMEVVSKSSLEELLEEIFRYLTTAAALVPNSSTVPIPHANADLLYQLDSISQRVCQLIIKHQQDLGAIGGVSSPLLLQEYENYTVILPRFISMSELQRHRRQFVKMNSQHPPSNSVAVGRAFVEFLLSQIE